MPTRRLQQPHRIGLSRRSLGQWILGLVVMGSLTVSANRAGATAVQPVDALHALLIQAMQRGGTTADRAALLNPQLPRLFDFETMTRVALGGGWRDLDDAGKTAMVDRFAAFTAANYAANFKSYSGEQFETLGQEASSGGRERVNARLVRTKGDPIAFEYLVHDRGGWRIIDVVVDGAISELARRRSEFAGLQRSGGTAAVANALEERTRELMP